MFEMLQVVLRDTWYHYFPSKSNLERHVDQEFKLLCEAGVCKPQDEQAIILDYEKEIKALVHKFSGTGQSGGSAPYTISIIIETLKALLSWEPIAPITGSDSEWNDVGVAYGNDHSCYQNNRCSAVFKDGLSASPYYLEALVFEGDKTGRFTGSGVTLPDGTTIGSRLFIKEFPFKPKTFYVDVLEIEWADQAETVEKVGGGWWTAKIKDPEQLEAVLAYYHRHDPALVLS